MGSGTAAFVYKFQFPLIFGSAVLAAVAAFVNREYFKSKIRGQGAEIFKNDESAARILEKFIEDERKM